MFISRCIFHATHSPVLFLSFHFFYLFPYQFSYCISPPSFSLMNALSPPFPCCMTLRCRSLYSEPPSPNYPSHVVLHCREAQMRRPCWAYQHLHKSEGEAGLELRQIRKLEPDRLMTGGGGRAYWRPHSRAALISACIGAHQRGPRALESRGGPGESELYWERARLPESCSPRQIVVFDPTRDCGFGGAVGRPGSGCLSREPFSGRFRQGPPMLLGKPC